MGVKSQKWLKLFLTYSALAGFCVLLLALPEQIASQTGWQWVDNKVAKDIILNTSIITVIISVIFIVLAGIDYVKYRFAMRAAFKGYMATVCRLNDLDKVDKMSSDLFDSQSSSLEQIRALYNIDPSCFWKVVEIGNQANGSVHGYFCVLKLSKMGVDSIIRGDFKGNAIPPEYLRKKGSAKDLYLGAVFGDCRYSKGVIMGALQAYIKGLGAERVYARPLTNDGVRLATKYGFRPVSVQNVGPMGALHVAQL